MAEPTRIEHDAFGPVEVPAARYWGAQTQRALGVFTIGTERFPDCLIRAFGWQKAAAARANLRCGVLDAARADAIVAAALAMGDGRHAQDFPLTIWQTGSGTQTNMNANEVIANAANEALGQPRGSRSPVHPNDHVNASQSSNDSFPTVMHIACTLELQQRLLPALALLRDSLAERTRAFGGVVKIARTHLMDAVPMMVDQAFDAFTRQVALGMARVEATLPDLRVLPQGGTAAGTGLNTPAGFDAVFCEEISALTGTAFVPNPSKFEGMAVHDALVAASGALNTLATSLVKMANDVRLLGSGPRCGLGELRIPDDGLTSSIMPGKRNPTIAEVLVQAGLQVMGNHLTIGMANAAGQFELNVAKPLLVHNLLQSIRVLADAARVFATGLVAGLELDREQLDRNVRNALLTVTVLNPVLGYDRVAQIVRETVASGRTPREVAVGAGFLSAADYDRLVDAAAMAAPHAAPQA
ncbi:class II fumarate hydratase [Xylophilus sp. Kf1]|nr:class II fumarate hydratase [Xylophilus sp. Kf1]